MRWIAPWLLIGCATTQAPRYSAPPWSDTETERTTISCALDRTFGSAAAAKFMSTPIYVRPGYPLRGLYEPGGRGQIYLRAEARSAAESPLEHEAVHVALYLLTGDAFREPRCWTSDSFIEAERRFNDAYQQCRRPP